MPLQRHWPAQAGVEVDEVEEEGQDTVRNGGAIEASRLDQGA